LDLISLTGAFNSASSISNLSAFIITKEEIKGKREKRKKQEGYSLTLLPFTYYLFFCCTERVTGTIFSA